MLTSENILLAKGAWADAKKLVELELALVKSEVSNFRAAAIRFTVVTALFFLFLVPTLFFFGFSISEVLVANVGWTAGQSYLAVALLGTAISALLATILWFKFRRN
jgi:hypothetical protein